MNQTNGEDKTQGPVATPENLAALLTALDSKNGLVRRDARQALVDQGRPAVAPLIEALSDPHAYTRWEATKALGEIGAPEGAPGLVLALEDKDSGVRWLGAEGLISLGRDGLPALLRALVERDGSVWLREGAHHVLCALPEEGLDDEVAALIAALEDVAPVVQAPEAARRALVRLESTRAVS